MLGTTYQLRPATSGDGAFLWALHERTLKDHVTRTWGWDEADQRARFAAWFVPARFSIIVCDGQDVGALRVEREPARLWLGDLLIAPAWQRRGLGTRIVGALLDEARLGGRPLGLRVLKVNPARRLYERLGLRVVEETDTHFVMQS